MPTPTYVAIAKTVLTGNQATITFSTIPSTYTDLVLSISARSDYASFQDDIKVSFNNDSSSLYSDTTLWTNSSTTAGSFRDSGFPWAPVPALTGATNTTANTFNNGELYIPNYAGSTNKVFSATQTESNNSTLYFSIAAVAGLYRSTTAISRIDLVPRNGTNFVSGSRFDLYGIKNS